jgi:TRAP-type C4-dicarboxylate transport system permease small subunit
MRGFRAFLLKIEEWSLILMLIALLTMVFLEVVLRYLSLPLFWTEEITRYLFIWIIMIGSIVGIEKKLHFKVELIVRAFPQHLQRAIGLFGQFAIISFLLIMGIFGMKIYPSMAGVVTPSLGLPQFLPFSVIPVASFLMLLHLSLEIIGGAASKGRN